MEDSLRVAQRILSIFKAVNSLELQTGDHKSCCVCGEPNILAEVELSEEVVNVLMEALLVEIGDKERTEYSAMWVCAVCWGSVGSLVDLFQQLEALRLKFNELRSRLGEKVILGSLGESKEAYESWLVEVNSVEDVFPSGAINRLVRTKDNVANAGSYVEVLEDLLKSEEEDEMFAVESLELLEYVIDNLEERKDDPKLTKMRATVVLTRLSDLTLDPQLREPKLNEKANEVSVGNELINKFSLDERHCETVNQLLETSDDVDDNDDFCPNETESCLTSSESQGFSNRGSLEKVGVADKGELKISSEQMILCGYCDLTFPTKLSWEYHRHRIHPLDSADMNNLYEYCSQGIVDKMLLSGVSAIDDETVSRLPNKSPRIRLSGEGEKLADCFSTTEILERETENNQDECEQRQSPPSQEIQCDSTEANLGRQATQKRLGKYSKSKRVHSARELGVLDSGVDDEEDQFSGNNSESSVEEDAEKETPCGLCDLTFPTKHLAKEHQSYLHSLDSSNSKTPKCSYCLKMFVKRYALYCHLSLVHYGIFKTEVVKGENRKQRVYLKNPKERKDATKIHCSICDKMQKNCFSDIKELEAHSLTTSHLEAVKLKLNVHCNTCRLGFGDNVDALKNHLESQEHLEEIKMLGIVNRATFCIPCRLDCETKNNMRKHRSSRKHWNTCSAFMASRVPMKLRRKQNIQCPMCPQKLSTREVFRIHFRSFHKQGGFVCEICGKAFPLLLDYKSHRRIHGIPKTLACPQCSRMFQTVKQLQRHQNQYHSGGSLICPTCGKIFNAKASLDRHELEHRSTEDGIFHRYSCTLCSMEFSTPKQLRRHVYKTHKDTALKDTPHVCLVCFKGYKTSDELNVHMAAHDTLKCYFCGRYFEQITNLENHVRMHIGEKPFVCTYCDKTFGAVHNMQTHVRWHLKMKDKNKTVKHNDE